MHFDKDGKFVRTDIWREGKWLDLWSVVHFLSGITMGFLPRYFNLETVSAYFIAFLLLVLYEMFEALAKIEEARTNRFMDVVVGMISFALAYSFNSLIPELWKFEVFIIFLVVAIVLGAIGWHASKKAVVFERKLKAEIMLQREKLNEKRLEFKEKMEERKKRRIQRKKDRLSQS